jgi:hypothetical protein
MTNPQMFCHLANCDILAAQVAMRTARREMNHTAAAVARTSAAVFTILRRFNRHFSSSFSGYYKKGQSFDYATNIINCQVDH